MERAINLDSENVYEITVRGEIDPSWLTGFGAVGLRAEVVPGVGHQSTLSRVVADQAGLVGLIRRLHGFGVVLVSVRHTPEAAGELGHRADSDADPYCLE